MDLLQSARRALPLALFAVLAGAGNAAALPTVSAGGDALVYTGAPREEHVYIDKSPVRDLDGVTVSYGFSVIDSSPGGLVTGTAGCEPSREYDAWCPPLSAMLEVSLGGGNDVFGTRDTEGLIVNLTCPPPQASAMLRLDGGAGADAIGGSSLADTIDGGPGADAIEGYGGADTVNGGSGPDLIDTFDGDDIVDGGAGNDRIDLDVLDRGGDGCYVRTGKQGDDVGRGGAGNDIVMALEGDDRLEGGAGNDDLNGGAGHDTLLGGPGNDHIWSRDGQRDVVNCGPGKDVVDGSDRVDRMIGCEKRTLRPR